MEPLKRCVLLALALLQVAVLAEETVCGSEGAGCRVVRESRGLLVVECSDLLDLEEKSVAKLGNSSENGSSNTSNVNDTWCEISNKTLVDDDHHLVDNFNLTDLQTENSLSSENSQHRGNDSKNNPLLRISSLEVNLLGNVSVFDISYYSNLKTVILIINGSDISRVCGATNVSALTITSSSIINLNFVKFFSNLNYLNLSHNTLKSIIDSEFPPTISIIDLSFNNIAFNTNFSFPRSLRLCNISYNNISNDKEFILKGNVIVLDIRGNKLSHVPVIEMNILEELYLSYNKISNLNENTFMGLSNLTVLDLRANRLNTIGEKVFQGLTRLQWLDLSENNLMSLAPATFQYLSNLVTLLLSKNVNLGNLQYLEDASLLFGTGQRLQEIEASGTNLSRIPSTVTRSVRKLLLTDNTICTIQCGEVDSFPLLQVIDVSNNMISEIEEDALGRLEFLSELLLSRNKLSSIPKSLPSQLQVLDLKCNSINKLNNIDFLGLQKLRVLLLSTNNISVIEDGAFGQLISLDVLDLSYNPIKTLYRSSFTGPRKLKELYLISLKELIPLKEPLTFPAPESSHLEILNLDSSSELATRLMDDVAALTMFHELCELNLRNCRLQSLRSDLPSFLPRLHRLEISNNPINCTDIAWLIKWLHSLNVSVQDTGSTKTNNCDDRYRSCKDVPEEKRLLNDGVKCAAPQELLGKPILTLQKYFPETTNPAPSTTEIPVPDSTTETFPVQKRSTTTAALTTTTSETIPTSPSINELVTMVTITGIAVLGKNASVNSILNNTYSKPSKVPKSQNAIHKLQNTWKYSKNQSKITYSTVEPFIVLLNDTKQAIGVIDNQENDSLEVSQEAFLAHARELPPTSHPGMMVFLLVVGVILVATSVMVYSHCRQLRRSSQYQHHQDIEVSSFGGHELW